MEKKFKNKEEVHEAVRQLAEDLEEYGADFILLAADEGGICNHVRSHTYNTIMMLIALMKQLSEDSRNATLSVLEPLNTYSAYKRKAFLEFFLLKSKSKLHE